jgi:hypothetical protein
MQKISPSHSLEDHVVFSFSGSVRVGQVVEIKALGLIIRMPDGVLLEIPTGWVIFNLTLEKKFKSAMAETLNLLAESNKLLKEKMEMLEARMSQ